MTQNLAMIDPTITITHPTDTEAIVRREFAAPADDLFAVWTTPALVRRWWSSFGEMSVCEIDARVGGTWRWGHFNREHSVEVAYFGSYLVVDRPGTLTFTEEFELLPDSSDSRAHQEECGNRRRRMSHAATIVPWSRDPIFP